MSLPPELVRIVSLCATSLALCTVIAPSPTHASLVVTRWTLETGVIGPDDQQFAFFPHTPVNPFNASHEANLAQSWARTTYSFSWSDFDGSFLVQGTHQAEDNAPTSQFASLSSGNIKFTTTQDLVFTVEGTYAYDLPSYGMSAYIGLSIGDRPFTQLFFNDYGTADTFGDGPQSGTLTFQG